MTINDYKWRKTENLAKNVVIIKIEFFSIWFYGFYGATVIITLWPNNWNNVFEIKGFETCNPHVEPQNVQFGKNDQMQFLKSKIFPEFEIFWFSISAESYPVRWSETMAPKR